MSVVADSVHAAPDPPSSACTRSPAVRSSHQMVAMLIDEGHRFRHASIRDAADERIPKHTRAELPPFAPPR